MRCLHAIGFANAATLEVVADIWRPVRMTPDLERQDLRDLNRRTLETLRAKSLLAGDPRGFSAFVIDRWPFPMWSLDLSPIKVDQDDLRREREDKWA